MFVASRGGRGKIPGVMCVVYISARPGSAVVTTRLTDTGFARLPWQRWAKQSGPLTISYLPPGATAHRWLLKFEPGVIRLIALDATSEGESAS